MDELPISIINYRTRDLTGKSVKSVLKYPPKCRFKIYLIDNNSEDGSLEYLETNFKDNIEFIRSETNLGFGKGHNLVL